MNKLTLTKCSSILRDPYNNKSKNIFYLLYNKARTLVNLKNMENYFVDFQWISFPKYAKQIFDEVGYGLRTGNTELFTKNLNENVYFALRDEKSDLKNLSDDYIVKLFSNKSFDWEIVSARCLYLNDMAEDFSQNFSQITMKYSTEQKKDNYIVFERCMAHNYSLYNWKIFIINYEYYKK
jgi:hypothetical protein